MKIKFLLAMLFVIALSFAGFAQTVIITPKKTVYKRPKPFADFKKSFTVIRPQVKGVSPAMAKKIESSISYENNFDFNLKEEMGEIQWLEEASFEVQYNKNGILGMLLMLDGSGAYPSMATRPVIVNLKTGAKVKPQDIFIKLGELAAKAKKIQQDEIKKSIDEIKKEEPEEENPASLFENADFKIENLNEFEINDRGVTFWYDYGFPHVIQALQPEGRYFFSYAELKPFIKPGGLLAKFVR